MISRGDLVKMRLKVGDDGKGKPLMDLFILGRVRNYVEDEDTYIVEPKVISVPKQHVAEIETLPKDFDFEDVSMELNMGAKENVRNKPEEVSEIRFHRPAS